MNTVRPPAVAGTFYPADPSNLRHSIQRYLEEASPSRLAEGQTLRALIAPHAGYLYSGPVAGYAYRCLADHRNGLRRVVLIGPAHRVLVHGLASSGADAFATPLGEAPVDLEARERILALPFVQIHDAAHREEHCLEVHLPFLQVLGNSFQILPLLVGNAPAEQVEAVLQALAAPDTLFLISSDLSHFHDYDTARRLDRVTADSIELMQPVESGQACGRLAINGLLSYGQSMGWRAHLLDLRNSGDTAGSRDRVVGYGAFSFTANGSVA